MRKLFAASQFDRVRHRRLVRVRRSSRSHHFERQDGSERTTEMFDHLRKLALGKILVGLVGLLLALGPDVPASGLGIGQLGAEFGHSGSLAGARNTGGPAVDLNFAASSYIGGMLASMVSVSRTASAFGQNADGSLSWFAPNVARVTTLGLWKEPARSNILLQSTNLANAVWQTFNNTFTTGQTGPDSSTNAALVVPDTTLQSHITYNPSGVTSTAGIATATMYFKPRGYNFALIGFIGGAYRVRAVVDLTTGFITQTSTKGSPVNFTTSAILYSNGWTRLIVSMTTDARANGTFLVYGPSPSGTPSADSSLNPSFNGDGVSGIYAFGPQIEPGSGGIATTYMPSTSSPGPRDTDLITFSGALATLLTQSTASIAVTTNKLQQATTNTFIAANGTDLIGKLSTDVGTTGVGAVLGTATTGAWAAPATLNLAWDETGGTLQLNSGAVASDATARTPSAPFTMGDAGFNGVISEIKGYNTKLALDTASSVPITGLTFGKVYKYNSGYPTKYIASDTWSNTWADDGSIYTLHDDTDNGGHWQATAPSSNMAVSKLSTFDTNTAGTILNVMAAFGTSGQLGSDSATWKGNGLISVSGVLYNFVSRQIYGVAGNGWRQNAFGGQLIKSTDHGTTWTPQPPSTAQPYASPMFTGENFAIPVFIQYGQDYQGNTVHNSNNYVYAISNNGFWNNGDAIYLGRVLISAIGNLSAAEWSFYTGGDGMNDANWSTSFANAVPLVSATKRLGIAGAQYLPASGRYLMMQWSYPSVTAGVTQDTSSTIWDIYESPTPWGPWTLVQTKQWNMAGAVGLYNPNVMPKSVTTDNGHTLMTLSAGDFHNENAQTGDYTLTMVPVTVNN
jgi:hypothetical protein